MLLQSLDNHDDDEGNNEEDVELWTCQLLSTTLQRQRPAHWRRCHWSVPLLLLEWLLRPGRGAEYCDQFVCLCVPVCPRAYLWNRWTDLHAFFVQIPCGHVSVLLWRHCDTWAESDVFFTCVERHLKSLTITSWILLKKLIFDCSSCYLHFITAKWPWFYCYFLTLFVHHSDLVISL